MKLIERIGHYISSRRKRWQGKFFCEYCKQEVIREIYAGNKSKSCGCNRGMKGETNPQFTHGKTRTPIHKLWGDMNKRCSPNTKSERTRKYYVDRGIRVCEEWRDFLTFEAWALPRYKPGLFIDRIDNDKGYSPDNCRFVTMKESNNNTRVALKAKSYIPKIQELINQGVSHEEIIKLGWIGKQTFYRYLRNGLLKRFQNQGYYERIKSQFPEIQTLLNQGLGLIPISKRVGVSDVTIRKYIKSGDLKRPNQNNENPL